MNRAFQSEANDRTSKDKCYYEPTSMHQESQMTFCPIRGTTFCPRRNKIAPLGSNTKPCPELSWLFLSYLS